MERDSAQPKVGREAGLVFVVLFPCGLISASGCRTNLKKRPRLPAEGERGLGAGCNRVKDSAAGRIVGRW
jgi:hypothetical protein